MKEKNSLILDKEFIDYCELNNIKDIEKLAKQVFNRGFTILKYGETPKSISVTKTSEPLPDLIPIVKPIPPVKPSSTDIYDE